MYTLWQTAFVRAVAYPFLLCSEIRVGRDDVGKPAVKIL